MDSKYIKNHIEEEWLTKISWDTLKYVENQTKEIYVI